ncbi:hypothetical protein [Gaetbulibacter aestuarii]|uniref:Uncharacterized protein n=1 Tax=Gaetbulibacter aestuarii TaxID=1502358 RepID=A0ABW7N1R9_9FLAO
MGKICHISEAVEACIFEIEMNYPELYHYLEETPFKDNTRKTFSDADYQAYFNSIQEILDHFQHHIFLKYQKQVRL